MRVHRPTSWLRNAAGLVVVLTIAGLVGTCVPGVAARAGTDHVLQARHAAWITDSTTTDSSSDRPLSSEPTRESAPSDLGEPETPVESTSDDFDPNESTEDVNWAEWAVAYRTSSKHARQTGSHEVRQAVAHEFSCRSAEFARMSIHHPALIRLHASLCRWTC